MVAGTGLDHETENIGATALYRGPAPDHHLPGFERVPPTPKRFGLPKNDLCPGAVDAGNGPVTLRLSTVCDTDRTYSTPRVDSFAPSWGITFFDRAAPRSHKRYPVSESNGPVAVVYVRHLRHLYPAPAFQAA